MAAGGTWTPVYIGIGSNLDDPARQVRLAVVSLGTLKECHSLCVSPLYSTRPVGPQNQPDFVNAVAGVLTRLEPPELLSALRALEKAQGKQTPAERFGPRRIDLDILVHGQAVFTSETLVVPHPRLHERAFVLYPLADVAPDLWIAGRGRVSALKATVSGDLVSVL